jgi:hypothetical protein
VLRGGKGHRGGEKSAGPTFLCSAPRGLANVPRKYARRNELSLQTGFRAKKRKRTRALFPRGRRSAGPHAHAQRPRPRPVFGSDLGISCAALSFARCSRTSRRGSPR